MQWLSLSNLFFLLIIPAILILYLLKRKYENHQVSSVYLWNKMLRDLEANKPWQKLQRNLLLILQLIVAIVLVVALIRPAIPTEGGIANHTIMVIDSTGSMAATEGDFTRFQLAKGQAKKVIEGLGDNQKITIVEMGMTPKIKVSNSSDKNVLLQALDSISLRPGTGDELATFSLASSIAVNDSAGIMWFSDGANSTLSPKKETVPENVIFKHVQVGKSDENVAIATFVTQKTDSGTEGLIRLENYGMANKEGNISIYGYDNNIIDSIDFKVKGNDSHSIELKKIPSSKAYKAILEVDNDKLSVDNQLWSVPFSKGEINAILVSPNGNRFLYQALKAGQLISLNMTNEIPEKMDKEVDFWIFDGTVPEELPNGNIIIIGPNKSTSWLPFYGEKDLSNPYEIVNQNHPILKHVKWEGIHISKLKNIGEINGIDPLIKSGENDVISAGIVKGKRVMLINFDLHQSDLPLRTAFPILIQNTIEWLTPNKTLPIGMAKPGEKILVPFSPSVESKSIITPKGENIRIDNVGTIIPISIPDEVGLYRIEEIRNSQKEERFFSVHPSVEESKIKPQFIQLTNHTTQTEDSENNGVNHKFGLKELSFWFILAALLISFIEWAVYKRGY